MMTALIELNTTIHQAGNHQITAQIRDVDQESLTYGVA